jgi:hypothetical protein
MIVTDYILSVISPSSAVLSWTSANTTDVSYIYINGVLASGPYLAGTTAREIRILFKENTQGKIEIHDLPSTTTETTFVVSAKENLRPLLSWVPVTDAVKYGIYISYENGTETLLTKALAVEGIDSYQYQTKTDLQEGWYKFRITTINDYGVESSGSIVDWRCYKAPEPKTLTITEDAGLFTFAIA